MNQHRLGIHLIALSVTIALMLAPAFAAEVESAQAAATELLDHLQAGQFDAATKGFNAELARALPASKLEEAWNSLPAKVGILKSRGEPIESTTGGGTQISVPLHYAQAELEASLVLDSDGRIARLLFRPAAPITPPAPADAPFTERKVTVAGLPGLLSMPKSAEQVPAVVLVGGSGPHDRDESIGPNKPFLDVARGLATHGIAVLRYDKRTYARPQDFADGNVTLDAEVTDDAVAAIALLASTPNIDPHRVYLLGHSEGGMLAPRIAAQSGRTAGVILWAAPGRPVLDLLPDQFSYLYSLDGSESVEEKAKLVTLEQQIRAIRSGQDPQPQLLHSPASYWREADQVNAIADLSRLSLPVLWLQGGRDFQVTAPDWSRWTQALADRKRSTEHFYPALNHLGIAAGSGPGSPAEYQQLGHVDQSLINDVANWIKSQP